MNQNQYNYNQPSNVKITQPNTDSKGTASIIIGVITIILSLILGCLVLPLGVVGLIFGIICKTYKKTAGIVLNIIGIILSIIMTVILGTILVGIFAFIKNDIESGFDDLPNFYNTDNYSIQYKNPWSEVTVDTNNMDGLMYGEDELYFLNLGVRSLKDVENKLACNYENASCQSKLYNSFYNYWNNDQEVNKLIDGDNKFNYLKYDADYTTISYGESENDVKGKLYLVVSTNKNIVIGFISKSDNYKSEYDDLIIELLDSIVIYNYEDEYEDDIDDDSDLGDTLDDLANWNRYKDLRSGNISHNKAISGGWRILSDSETYWVFKNNEFWWYKSVNDLDDNYWYGTTEIVTGKDGLKKAGLSEDKVDQIIKQSNGNVTANDIYTIICTPTKIISDGVDKSSTNIPEDYKWTYVWIVVDHGTEGVEAQVLNMSVYETSYYVKLND